MKRYLQEKLRQHLKLYAITDRQYLRKGMTICDAVQQAIDGGITMLQLREKNADRELIRQEAVQLKQICREHDIPFLIDDDVELAAEVDADGVHVGQEDMSVIRARQILGPDKIIGATAHNLSEALQAQSDGADYIGSGAAFQTSSKSDASSIDHNEYGRITSAVDIPVVAIGGITADNVDQLRGYGLAGIAVIAGIFDSDDVRQSTAELARHLL